MYVGPKLVKHRQGLITNIFNGVLMTQAFHKKLVNSLHALFTLCDPLYILSVLHFNHADMGKFIKKIIDFKIHQNCLIGSKVTVF